MTEWPDGESAGLAQGAVPSPRAQPVDTCSPLAAAVTPEAEKWLESGVGMPRFWKDH